MTSRALPKSSNQTRSLYIQYGCGLVAPEEWSNFDASPTLLWERIPILGRYTKNSNHFPANVRPGNIVKGLPVPDESCQGVYASHVLEHLTLEDFHKALDNTYRMLRTGGIFRIVVPDLEWAAREYIDRLERAQPQANSFFLRETGLGTEKKEAGLKGLAHAMLNRSAHLWMWDESSLDHALQEHGFNERRRCHFGDCEDRMFSLVEGRDRFEKAVAMEAKK